MKSKLSKRKALYLAMSIVMACAIWFYVDETNDNYPQQEFRDIPIEYLNEDLVLADRGLMLVEDGTDETIDITLEGRRRLIAQVSRSNIRVTADLSDITSAGIQTVKLTTTFPGKMLNGKRFPLSSSNVKERSIEVATVNIQELNSKEIPIKCEIVGSVAEGFTAGKLQLSRESMEIRGQAEDIGPVAYGKVVLNLGDTEETVSEELTIHYYDEHDQQLPGRRVHSTAGDSVTVTLPVTVVKELQLAMDFIEAPGASRKNISFRIDPPAITVSGDAGMLKDMDRIVLSDFALTRLISNPESTTHTYPITVPDGCENLSGVTRATLNISFLDMKREARTTSHFTYENLPEGKTCTVLTEELTVAIFGTAANVAAVKDEDVQVAADLTDFGAANGSYTVPAEVRITNGADVGVIGTQEVRVVISEEEPAAPPEPETPDGSEGAGQPAEQTRG